MMYQSGCIVCREDIVYLEQEEKVSCHVCGTETNAIARCRAGHFVCDACHQAEADNYIHTYCLHSEKTDPVLMAEEIMHHPSVNMHGPEHHFLVPAVLAVAYCNVIGEKAALPELLEKVKNRSQNVPGGFCGFFGNCGAAVGTGMFLSVIQNTTPLSEKEWRLCNLMTARSLETIANAGGPRCCKRNTFLAIDKAAVFLREHLGIDLPVSTPGCTFFEMNNECRREACRFFKEPEEK